MNAQDAQRANDLVNEMLDGIAMQKEILEAIQETVQRYQDFLVEEMKIAKEFSNEINS